MSMKEVSTKSMDSRALRTALDHENTGTSILKHSNLRIFGGHCIERYIQDYKATSFFVGSLQDKYYLANSSFTIPIRRYSILIYIYEKHGSSLLPIWHKFWDDHCFFLKDYSPFNAGLI